MSGNKIWFLGSNAFYGSRHIFALTCKSISLENKKGIFRVSNSTGFKYGATKILETPSNKSKITKYAANKEKVLTFQNS